jgi:hypothetical protein
LVLDTAFDEDRATNRKDRGRENLAILRRLALDVLRCAPPARPCPFGANESAAGRSDDFAAPLSAKMR